MKNVVLGTLFVLALGIFAAPPAAANTCSFTGNCLGASRWCQFDVTSSCSNGSTPSISATCTNNNSSYTGNPFTHQFATSAGGSCTVTCNCGLTSISVTRYVCFAFGVPGCIKPNIGPN